MELTHEFRSNSDHRIVRKRAAERDDEGEWSAFGMPAVLEVDGRTFVAFTDRYNAILDSRHVLELVKPRD